MPKQGIDPIWETSNVLSVKDAACLMAGVEPSCVDCDPLAPNPSNSLTCKPNTDGFDKVYGCFVRLAEAIRSKEVEAIVKYPAIKAQTGEFIKPSESEFKVIAWIYEGTNEQYGEHPMICSKNIDWKESTIQKVHIVKWLKAIDFHDQFFNRITKEDDPLWDVLDSDGKTHSRRLAAAIKAWREVNDPDSKYLCKRYSTPKTAIEAYLEENSKELGLYDEYGKPPTDNALKTIATVASWDSTPGRREEKNQG